MGRHFSSTTPELVLAANLETGGSTLTVESAEGIPSVPFTLVVNPDTIKEEIVTVTGFVGNQFTVIRAEENTGPAKQHLTGDKARHMITGRDLQEVHDHMEQTESVHGISDTAFITYNNAAQTLTNKRLNSPKINEEVALTATATELNRVAGVTSAVQTQLNNKPGIKVSGSDAANRTIFVQSAQPTANAVGDIWFQVTGL